MLSPMKRAALIVNPFASRVSEQRLAAVEEALAPHAEIETLPTARGGHAVELAREAARTRDAVLVYSGDGGFNEVLNGLDGPVPLGFIPGGRTNVLPRALGLPRDPVAAAQRIGNALDRDRTRTISVGRVNGRRFGFAAGVGVDAEFIRRIDQHRRGHDSRLPGDLVAALLLARQFAEHRGGYEPALEIQGLGRVATVLVANGEPTTYAGPLGLRLVPAATFQDGLDFAAPPLLRARDFASVALRSLRGHEPPGFLYGHDLDRIRVVCDSPTPLQADGEDLGDVEEATFECERAAVRVLVGD